MQKQHSVALPIPRAAQSRARSWSNKNESGMSTILLIEPHPLLRLGLCQLLQQLQIPEHVVEIEPAEASLPHQAALHDAELLIYGCPEPGPWNAGMLEAWCDRLRPRRVLVLADGTPEQFPPAIMPDIVRGWLSKSSCAQALAAAIRLVLAGGECFPAPLQADNARDRLGGRIGGLQPASSTPVCRSAASSGADADVTIEVDIETPSLGAHRLNITERQYEVLVLLARGYPIKTVSRMLNISVATAKTHACTLYQRLHVRNKGEAVYEALRRGAKLNWPGPAAPLSGLPRREVTPLVEVIQAA